MLLQGEKSTYKANEGSTHEAASTEGKKRENGVKGRGWRLGGEELRRTIVARRALPGKQKAARAAQCTRR